MTRARRVLLALMLVAVSAAVFAAGGCASPPAADTVTVLGSWTGAEQDGFMAMVSGFEQKYGIKVRYTGTRGADAVLATDVKDGNPPDLAVLATPGELDQYARDGALLPIDAALRSTGLTSEYGPGWRKLMQAPGHDGATHYFAIFVKAALKSVIWYDPKTLPAPDARLLTSPDLTWAQLTGLTARLVGPGKSPWCMGLEDSSSSGWPGTDWIEDILLHQSGPRVYDQWVNGTLPWMSEPVVRAWQTFGEIANTPRQVHGGTQGELLTSYAAAGQPMFSDPPGCYLDHEGSFITGFYTQDTLGSLDSKEHPRPRTDFNFVPFPALAAAGQGTEEVAGDLLGLFNDTPAARELIAYLTTPQAQEAWISRPGSGAISVNQRVPLGDYPDPVSQALAKDLTSATDVRFDASDSMPQMMQNAFLNAVLEYLDAPSQLNAILRGLDQVRAAAY
ncbi:MAG: carbohydrate ABC transporter substrate-binding protein [Streptosporangiaceae bacterium]|nr:carbohydrate ABC transporter substrate-binding protein [Streptosporangiaceae bacterium]